MDPAKVQEAGADERKRLGKYQVTDEFDGAHYYLELDGEAIEERWVDEEQSNCEDAQEEDGGNETELRGDT